MSYLLETLGRGWLSGLSDAFQDQLQQASEHDMHTLLRLVRHEPDRPDLQLDLGFAYLKAGEPAKARRAFSSAVQMDPGSVLARVAAACCLEALGLIEEATSQLSVAADLDADDAVIQFALGYCHERQKRIGEAVIHYRCALRSCPGLRNARERLAAIFIHQNQLAEAIEQYEEMLIDEPGDVDLHLTAANLYLRKDDPNRAIRSFENALTIEPDNWQAQDDLVDTCEQSGLLREAIEQLHVRLAKQPEFADNYLRLGDLYSRVGNDEGAMDAYMKAVDLHPGYLEAIVKVGTQHLRSGEYVDAASWFARAIEINDRLLTGYVGLGVAQFEAGLKSEALSSIDLASSIEPNSTLLYTEMARLQLKCGVQQEADRYLSPPPPPEVAGPPEERMDNLIESQIDRHRRAAEAHPSHPDVHYRLGLLLRQQGRLEEAITHFQRAVDINPVYAKAVIKLGLALYEAGRSEDAITMLQQALELNPEYVDLHYRLGTIFADRHQFELAVEHFDAAVAGNPQNLDFRENLAIALENIGMIDRARSMWYRICEMAPESTQARHAREAIRRY